MSRGQAARDRAVFLEAAEIQRLTELYDAPGPNCEPSCAEREHFTGNTHAADQRAARKRIAAAKQEAGNS